MKRMPVKLVTVGATWIGRSFLLLPLMLLTMLKTSAKVGLSWPISYKAELLARIIDADPAVLYYDPGQNRGHIGFKLARTSYFFTGMSEQERLYYNRDICRVIFSYVLGDSSTYFSDVYLSYYQLDDTAVHRLYRYGPGEKDTLTLSDSSPEDRFILLANVLPVSSLAASNSSRKYKKRMMGFSLPSAVDGLKYKWDEVSRTTYATAIASLLYDFVLQRKDDLVSTLVIQFRDNYSDLNIRPVAENDFPINGRFIQDIRTRNVMMLRHPDPGFDQVVLTTDIETRLAILSFLVQGKIAYWYHAPVGDRKGKCFLDCHFKSSGTTLPIGNTPDRLVRRMGNLIIDYCLLDSLELFDSVTVRLFDDKSLLMAGLSFVVPPSSKNTTEDERMGFLLDVLPFRASVHLGGDEFEVSLREVPEYSPVDNLGAYVTILSLAAFEYVFRYQKKSATISFVDLEEQAKAYYPTVDGYNTAIHYLQAVVPFRRLSNGE